MMKKIALFFVFLLVSFVYAQSTQPSSQSEFQNFITSTIDSLNNAADNFVRTGGVITTSTASGVEKMFNALGEGSCDTNAVGMEYIELTILAIFIVAMVDVLLYMAGHVLQMPNLIAFAKDEGLALFFVILAVGSTIGVATTGDYFYRIATANAPPTEIVYYGKTTYIDAALAFNRLMLAEISKNYTALVLFNTILHIFYTASLYVGTNFRSMYNFNLGSALKPFMDLVSMGLQAMGVAIGEWLVQGMVLCFIKKWTWAVFMPLAIFLRSFPQTRQVGVALYALLTALIIIYPMMLIVMYESHKLLQPYLSDSLETIKDMAQSTGIFGITGMVLALAVVGGAALIPVIGGIVAMGAYDLLKNTVYYVVIMGAILPFFTIFITLTWAREFARLLGVEVNYMSFLKII